MYWDHIIHNPMTGLAHSSSCSNWTDPSVPALQMRLQQICLLNEHAPRTSGKYIHDIFGFIHIKVVFRLFACVSECTDERLRIVKLYPKWKNLEESHGCLLWILLESWQSWYDFIISSWNVAPLCTAKKLWMRISLQIWHRCRTTWSRTPGLKSAHGGHGAVKCTEVGFVDRGAECWQLNLEVSSVKQIIPTALFSEFGLDWNQKQET